MAAISVDLDLTFVGQMVIFSTLIVILRPLLFEPVLRIFEERERRASGARAEARRMQEEAGVLLRRYDVELERLRRVAAEEREGVRAELGRIETRALDEAREAAKVIVTQGRARIEQEVNAIRFDLGGASERLGRDIARTVLGREIN